MISLSNIGDVVLTLPVVDILNRDFPAAAVSIVVGPKAESLLRDSKVFEQVIILNKKQPLSDLWKWIGQLRKCRFDLVVDLRNSMIPFMLWPRYMTLPETRRKKEWHMRDKHIARLRSVYAFEDNSVQHRCLDVTPANAQAVDQLLSEDGGITGPFVVMAPGSADQSKRWSKKGFATVAKYLKKEYDLGIVFLGDEQDDLIVREIITQLNEPAVNLCGRTSLCQSAEIVRRGVLAVVNDSAVLHLAGYHNIPTVALFGYTNPVKYGPWSQQQVVMQPAEPRPTVQSSTRERVDYIESISPEKVVRSISLRQGKVELIQP